MEEEQKKEKRFNFIKKKKKEIIITVVTLLILVGISYAWLRQTVTSNQKNVLMAGKLRLTILNEDPIVKAGGEDGYAIPMDDSVGLATKPYTFTVENTGTIDASFGISLVDASSYNETTSVGGYGYGYSSGNSVERQITSSSQRIPDNKIKYNLREGSDTNTNTALLSSASNRILVTGTLAPGASKTYQLRLWIDSAAEASDVEDKTFAANLKIDAIQYGGGAQAQGLADGTYYMEKGIITSVGSPIPTGTSVSTSLSGVSTTVSSTGGLYIAIKNVVSGGKITSSCIAYQEFDAYFNTTEKCINTSSGTTDLNEAASRFSATYSASLSSFSISGASGLQLKFNYSDNGCFITSSGVAACGNGCYSGGTSCFYNDTTFDTYGSSY